MLNNYLPEKFKQFESVTKLIHSYNPVNISIIGSYGDYNKKPNPHSDFDIIYVFETNNIFELNQKINQSIKEIQNLKVLELGVHFQFGFVCSLYFLNNPMSWMDIGIMDINFAQNYLCNLPKEDIFGTFKTSGIKEVPKNHLNNLGRKIVKYLNKGHLLQAKIASYRYLNWLNVENKVKRLKKIKFDERFDSIYNNNKEINEEQILEFVLEKIKQNDYEVFQQLTEINE